MHSRQSNHQPDASAYQLTELEKEWLGLKKPVKPKGNIQIVIPVHYGSHGVIWESRWVTSSELDWYEECYPNLQIIDLEPTRVPTMAEIREARKKGGTILWL